jgi:hypothetical protein
MYNVYLSTQSSVTQIQIEDFEAAVAAFLRAHSQKSLGLGSMEAVLGAVLEAALRRA